jgi:hypothetical protein
MPDEKTLFERAATDARDALDPYVQRILEIIGHPEAMVTDESTVRDFLNAMGWAGEWRRGHHGPWTPSPADPQAQAENEEKLRTLREMLRVPVEAEDFIVDVARRLRALGQA